MEELKLEITSLLASVYMAQHKHSEAVKLINKTIELAINYQFWYCQMCFQLAKANMDLGNIKYDNYLLVLSLLFHLEIVKHNRLLSHVGMT